MSKIDWTKAGTTNADPGRVAANAREFDVFVPTEAGRREFASAKQVGSRAAKQSAATRKANREHEALAQLQAQADEIARREQEKAFFSKIQAKLNNRNELQSLKKEISKPAISSFGSILKEAFDKIPKP
jgi:hypothetical protein